MMPHKVLTQTESNTCHNGDEYSASHCYVYHVSHFKSFCFCQICCQKHVIKNVHLNKITDFYSSTGQVIQNDIKTLIY